MASVTVTAGNIQLFQTSWRQPFSHILNCNLSSFGSHGVNHYEHRLVITIINELVTGAAKRQSGLNQASIHVFHIFLDSPHKRSIKCRQSGRHIHNTCRIMLGVGKHVNNAHRLMTPEHSKTQSYWALPAGCSLIPPN